MATSEAAALLFAAERGAVQSIRDWSARGGDVNAPIGTEMASPLGASATPLQWAAYHGHAMAVRSLLECGARDFRAPHAAARQGHSAVLEALLEWGMDPNAADEYGQTPLHYAAAFGQVPCLRQLLRCGASAGLREVSGRTPADLAAAAGYLDAAAVLLQQQQQQQHAGAAGMPPASPVGSGGAAAGIGVGGGQSAPWQSTPWGSPAAAPASAAAPGAFAAIPPGASIGPAPAAAYPAASPSAWAWRFASPYAGPGAAPAAAAAGPAPAEYSGGSSGAAFGPSRLPYGFGAAGAGVGGSTGGFPPYGPFAPSAGLHAATVHALRTQQQQQQPPAGTAPAAAPAAGPAGAALGGLSGGFADTGIAQQYAAAQYMMEQQALAHSYPQQQLQALGGSLPGRGPAGVGAFSSAAGDSLPPASSAASTSALRGTQALPVPLPPAAQLADARSRLRDWLTSIGMLYALPALITAGYDDVDFIAAAGLSDGDIDGLGITAPGHRRKLLHLYGIDGYAVTRRSGGLEGLPAGGAAAAAGGDGASAADSSGGREAKAGGKGRAVSPVSAPGEDSDAEEEEEEDGDADSEEEEDEEEGEEEEEEEEEA